MQFGVPHPESNCVLVFCQSGLSTHITDRITEPFAQPAKLTLTSPKGPCDSMVYTWALKGFLCPYFGVYDVL